MKFYVYLAQHVHTTHKPFKVGVARNVDRRLETLQTGNPYELAIIAKLGPFSRLQAYETERRLHRRLKNFKIRGEWFREIGLAVALR